MLTKVTYRHGCWSHVQNPGTGLGDQTPEGLTNCFGVGIIFSSSDHPLAVNTLALRSGFRPPELPDGQAVLALSFYDASLLHGILLHRDFGALGLSRNGIIALRRRCCIRSNPSGSTSFMYVCRNVFQRKTLNRGWWGRGVRGEGARLPCTHELVALASGIRGHKTTSRYKFGLDA